MNSLPRHGNLPGVSDPSPDAPAASSDGPLSTPALGDLAGSDELGVPAAHLALPTSLHRPRAIAAALAVAECLYVSESGPPPPARLTWLGRELDDFLERIGPDARTSYLAGVLLVSLLAPLLSGSVTPLRRMSLDRRTKALDRMDSSFASGLLLAVKAMLCIIYYEHPDAAASIGFDGQCMLAGQPAATDPGLISADALYRPHD